MANNNCVIKILLTNFHFDDLSFCLCVCREQQEIQCFWFCTFSLHVKQALIYRVTPGVLNQGSGAPLVAIICLNLTLIYYKLWLGVPPNCSITRKGYRESRLRTTVLHYSHMSWLPPFPLEWSERSNCGHGWEQWGSTEIYFDYSIFFQFKIMIVQKKNFCRWFMNTFVTSKRKIFIKRMLIINIFKYKIYLTPLPDLGLPNQLIKSFNWRTATDLCYVNTSVM